VVGLALLFCACTEGRPDIVVMAGDAGLDAGSTPDAGVSCAEACTANDPCDEARCEDGRCLHRVRADGETCPAEVESLCVEAECRVRGCGDGWREHGSGAPREGCDHAGATSFCDAACDPIAGLLIEGIEIEEATDLAVAVDGEERVLVVRVERAIGEAIVWGHLFDRRLRAIAPPFVLARTGNDRAPIAPAVAGLARGFALAMVRPPDGLVVGALDPDALDAPGFAPWDESAADVEPRVAALSDGFVVVATDLAGAPDDPLGGPRARLFDARARPRGDAFRVASDRGGFEAEASICSAGDAWIAAFTAYGAKGEHVRVRARLFADRAPLGADFDLAPADVHSWAPSCAALDGGGHAIAWLERGESISIHSALARETLEIEASLEASSAERALLAPRPVPLAEGALALLYVEGASPSALRLIESGETPPELARAVEQAPPSVRFARGPRDIVFVWSERAGVRAFVVAAH
jgi:hypothetical protein